MPHDGAAVNAQIVPDQSLTQAEIGSHRALRIDHLGVSLMQEHRVAILPSSPLRRSCGYVDIRAVSGAFLYAIAVPRARRDESDVSVPRTGHRVPHRAVSTGHRQKTIWSVHAHNMGDSLHMPETIRNLTCGVGRAGDRVPPSIPLAAAQSASSARRPNRRLPGNKLSSGRNGGGID